MDTYDKQGKVSIDRILKQNLRQFICAKWELLGISGESDHCKSLQSMVIGILGNKWEELSLSSSPSGPKEKAPPAGCLIFKNQSNDHRKNLER